MGKRRYYVSNKRAFGVVVGTSDSYRLCQLIDREQTEGHRNVATFERGQDALARTVAKLLNDWEVRR